MSQSAFRYKWAAIRPDGHIVAHYSVFAISWQIAGCYTPACWGAGILVVIKAELRITWLLPNSRQVCSISEASRSFPEQSGGFPEQVPKNSRTTLREIPKLAEGFCTAFRYQVIAR
ncbi:hypothetical protein ACFSJU_16345 [Paradesertivirga mongoliensis]|uniref:Uncharacterized protein n=1 Tax=Paradesertivirga mongoliensis TaxID=2100740 RepID=A0ABW4ZPG6_9SPHI|nr:hypothetical protein [Pedobacter mongoliensis]